MSSRLRPLHGEDIIVAGAVAHMTETVIREVPQVPLDFVGPPE